jgi:hypothetical protein
MLTVKDIVDYWLPRIKTGFRDLDPLVKHLCKTIGLTLLFIASLWFTATDEHCTECRVIIALFVYLPSGVVGILFWMILLDRIHDKLIHGGRKYAAWDSWAEE